VDGLTTTRVLRSVVRLRLHWKISLLRCHGTLPPLRKVHALRLRLHEVADSLQAWVAFLPAPAVQALRLESKAVQRVLIVDEAVA